MTLHEKILAGLTALLLFGAGVRIARSAEAPRVIWPEIPTVAETSGRGEAQPLAAAQEAALNGNVFSASRTPPRTRFRLGSELEAMEETPVAEAGYVEPAAPPPPPRYRVAGTMMLGPAGGVALIDADPSSPMPEVYRTGDAVGGYRLERIEYDHVVLVGTTGEVRMDVAKPGEAPRMAQAYEGPPVDPAAAAAAETRFPKAKSSANTPPGAIPPGW